MAEEGAVLNSLAAVRRIEDDFTRALDSTMRSLERQMMALLDNAQRVPAVDAALARAEVQNILVSSGYYQATGDLLNAGYQSAIDEAQNFYFQTIGENFQFSETSLERLTALKNIDLGEYANLADNFSTQLTRTLVDLNFGSVDIGAAVRQLQDSVDQLGNHARTWVTTGLSGVYSESSIALAEDNGITEFVYVGPIDAITRPFCRQHIGEKRTKEEWNKLDNGQISPVSTYRGGFNCRHQLVGVK